MILACDGIWNFMSSQEVIDYVGKKIDTTSEDKLSTICEELFEHCLAPDTMGDGTGCDNMTAVIVKFKPSFSTLKNVITNGSSVNGSSKRAEEEPSEEEPVSKKAKLDSSEI